mmetsp:Transcript_33988/g.85616  ORF Transcript_33988/g.85616 Transcript_33988/m.85616 type:complete len:366 (+) Transcript_33988:1111-2208(+)
MRRHSGPEGCHYARAADSVHPVRRVCDDRVHCGVRAVRVRHGGGGVHAEGGGADGDARRGAAGGRQAAGELRGAAGAARRGVPLPHAPRPARAAGHQPHDTPGAADRHRGAQRQREEHAHGAAAAPVRPLRGRAASGRRAAERAGCWLVPPPDRRRQPGTKALLHHHRRQHRLRGRRDPRGARGRGAPVQRRRVHHPAAGGLRHACDEQHAQRRPEAAHRDRACAGARPGLAAAGRGHQRAGRGERDAGAGHTGWHHGGVPGQQGRGGHRAPPVHGPQRAADRRNEQGADRRDWRPRDTADAAGHLLGAGSAARGGAGHGREDGRRRRRRFGSHGLPDQTGLECLREVWQHADGRRIAADQPGEQ